MPFSTAWAVNMVEQRVFYNSDIKAVGAPDFPPFSWYEKEKTESRGTFYTLKGAFISPTKEAMKKYQFKFEIQPQINTRDIQLPELILDVRGGVYQLIFGVYTGTKIFTGLGFLFPSVVSNPIHIISLPAILERIHTADDLKNLRGIAYKNEFISDYGRKKFEDLHITYTDSLYELYEKLFTDEADYIIGSEYYHKIMSSRFGIEKYLAYSKEPLFKIPVFIAMSKLMPKYSLYERAFSSEFNKPEYSLAVKKEILRIVQQEIEKNLGVVPPAFTKKIAQDKDIVEDSQTESISEPKKPDGGKIIEKHIEQKSDDEILDGI